MDCGFVVLSFDPRGFWHANFWSGRDGLTMEDIQLSGCSPDSFFIHRGCSAEVEAIARKACPNAQILFADDNEIEEALAEKENTDDR